jgi:1-acyl-sn-glycerol-3-phosphate acyltransferase
VIVQPGLVTRSLSVVGWAFETPKPPEKKYVLLCWPHTSNWDGLLLVLLARSIDLQLKWMVKDAWVNGPFGVVTKRVGAVPINRSKSTNVVEQMVEQFAQHDELALAIPPEGTRSRAEHWKSGFYWIALGAKVPVVPGYLDYGTKRAGLGPAITMTGDVRTDMNAIRAFYEKRNPTAADPSKVGPIRLREEG